MTLLQLELFITVCQEKSFTRAAESLHMTQSAVSQAISNLETELGVRLLIRERQKFTVTQIGERVLSHARDIIQHTVELKQEALAAAGTESGTLRIGVIREITSRLLPKLLGTFQSVHPDVQIELFEGTCNEVNNWITNHRIDLGFTTSRSNTLNDVDLVQDRFLLLVPKEHTLASEESVTLGRLKNEPYIQLRADSVQVIHQAFKEQGMSRPVQYELSETNAILEMVQQGLGITILPEMAIPEIMQNLVCVPLQPEILREIRFIVRDMNRVSPICAEFILHARRYAAKGS